MSATDIPARHGPWISTGRRRHFSRTLAATFLLAGCWLAYPALAQPLPRGLEDVHLAMPLKELAVKRPEAAPLFKKLDLSKTNQTIYEVRRGRDPTGNEVAGPYHPAGTLFTFKFLNGRLRQAEVKVFGKPGSLQQYQSVVIEECLKHWGTNYMVWFSLQEVRSNVTQVVPVVQWRSDTNAVAIMTMRPRLPSCECDFLWIRVFDPTGEDLRKELAETDVNPTAAARLLRELDPRLKPQPQLREGPPRSNR